MTSEIEQLARRAVACPGWRWMERMVDQYENTMLLVVDGAVAECVDRRGNYIDLVRDGRIGEARRLFATSIPDLADPATLGCMVGLVQAHLAALADRDAAHHHGLRVAMAWQDWLMGRPDRRALVMVAALEAAPVREVQP